MGYTSTTQSLETAVDFALEDIEEQQRADTSLLPVVFIINFQGSRGLFEMTPEYTAFPDEGEVLV